jgi:hypothetical protein
VLVQSCRAGRSRGKEVSSALMNSRPRSCGTVVPAELADSRVDPAGNSLLHVVLAKLQACGENLLAAVAHAVGDTANVSALKKLVQCEASEMQQTFMAEENATAAEMASKIAISLIRGRRMVEDICIVITLLFDIRMNVIQYHAGDKALHVSSYGGEQLGASILLQYGVFI